MATKKTRREWTFRVDDVATFLFRTPASPEQVLEVSQTWCEGNRFTSLDYTQRFLNRLCHAGWLSQSQDPAAKRFGGQFYYKLTLKGYREWKQDDRAEPPTKRFCDRLIEPKAHLIARSKFLAHFTIVAHARGFRIENDHPENTLAITVGNSTIWPDHHCELVGRFGRRFFPFFEFDRSTETLVSARKQQDTWKHKNAVYDAHQNILRGRKRIRVIPVVTESHERLRNILSRFAEQTSNPDRQLYVGVHLDDFLRDPDALCQPIFMDQNHRSTSFIPPSVLDRIACQNQPCQNSLNRLRFRTNICPCLADLIVGSRKDYCGASPSLVC